MIKRDVTSDSWNDRGGLKPEERIAEPFGPCWTSNLSSYIHFDEGSTEADPPIPPSAEVFDEMGSRQRYFLFGSTWVHDLQEGNDVKTRSNQLVSSGNQMGTHSSAGNTISFKAHSFSGLILKKKFGTTCHYEMISPSSLYQVLSPDRIKHEGQAQVRTFARLTKVVDRWGNELHYSYPTNVSLIPSKIFDPIREGHAICIKQDGGRVQQVRAPNGEITEYDYTDSRTLGLTEYGMSGTQLLTQVTKGASQVGYSYGDYQEQESLPPVPDEPPSVTQHHHLELAGITDERGGTYSFHYLPNNRFYFFDGKVRRRQYGLPMILNSVVSPPVQRADSPYALQTGTLNIITTRSIDAATGSATFTTPAFYTTFAWTHGIETRTYRYNFTLPKEIRPLKPATFAFPSNPNSVTFAFAGMSITAPDAKVETYVFNTATNMALSSAIDRNGGKTTFEYGTDGFDDPIKERAWISTTVSYDKLFTYHAATRILGSSTNPRGVKTLYSIDSLGRRLTETVKHPTNAIPGGHAKTWTFDDTFPGFMTSETSDEVTARTTGNPTTNYPAITKTMAYADPTTGLGWWRKITETISATSPLMKTTTITDFSGNKRSVTDGRGLTTRFDYDERGRLIRVTHPDSSFKVLDYDAHGNLVIEVDEESVYRFHEYDAWNRRIKSTLDLNGDRNADPRYTSSTVDAQGIRQYNGDLVTETRYNSMNLAVEEIDERSIVTRHTFDSLGRRLTTSVNATNLYASGPRNTAFTYQSATINGGKEVGGSVFDSSSFKPVQITDTRYGLTKFTYDALYRPVTVQSPNLAYVHTTYDKAGNVTSTCDPTTTLAPAKSIITGDLEANQRLTQVDSLSDAFAGVAVTHTFYDALGQPVRVEHPDGNNATTAYTFFGKPYVAKDETGLYTHARYNTAGLPFKTISSPTAVANENPGNVADPFTLTSYDAVGNVISARDPLGNVTETRYDSRNRPYKVIFPEVADALAPGATAANPIMRRPVTVTEYDALGRAIATTDPLGRTSRQFYDPAGRLVRSFDALDQATFMTYDASGKVTSVVNALGQKVTNFYDVFGQLKQTTDAAGIINQFAYDAAGNRTIVTDGLSRSTSFAYDTVNRLTTQTFPNGDDWRYTYNAVNKISQIDPKNVTTAYTYDVRNRLEKAGTRDLIYDVKGRLSKVNDMAVTADKTVEYTYDAYGRTLTEKSVGLIHTNEYDKAGNRIAVTYADGRKVSTTYDALKRPSVLVDDNGTPLDSTDNQTTRYGYDLAGRAVQLIAQNGQVTRNDYDELGRLTARTLFRSLTEMNDAGRLASFTWTHDAIGNVLTQTEFWFASGAQPARQRATAMTNDAANRLISETITEPGLAQVTTTYSYDAGNNRTTKAVTLGAGTPPPGLEIGHWTCTYNTANQLTRMDKRAAAGGAVVDGASYTYDANGNRLTKVEDGTGTAATRTTNYTWDIFDRLTTVAQPVSATLKQTYTYTYDYRTRRTGVARTLAGTSPARHTAVVFSGGLSVLEYDRATNTALTTSTASSVKYTRGPDMGGGVGGLLYTLRNPVNASGLPVAPGNTTPAVRKYNLSNGRGDIVAQSDSTGALTWTASYEAYGKRTKETGTNADKQRANTKDEDPTGLLNEGFRYRDIETGVWLSRDPAGFVDGPNVYCFVKQNPWSKFDPLGLAAKEAKEKKAPEAKLWKVTGDPSDPESVKKTLVTDMSKINGKSARIWINGMANNEQQAAELGLLHTGWKEFYMVHNPTQGGLRDLGECAKQKLGFDTKVAKTTKDLLSKFNLKSSTIVAHSQGTMIMNKALSELQKDGVDMKGVQLHYHGSAANVMRSQALAQKIGGSVQNFEGHSLDAVHNIVGMNTINPLRIAGSLAASPLLFMGRAISPHSTVQGGEKLPEVFKSPIFHP
jgi:RHS repeat-associated protein